MKTCPNTDHELVFEFLESGLPANRCPDCRGVWLGFNEYHVWLSGREDVPERNLADAPPEALLPVIDSDPQICPECSHFLRRFKVWPDIAFHLDRCRNCGGVWLDRNEWAVLKARGLHDNLHEFFTRAWQDQIQAAEEKEKLAAIYTRRFGAAGYAEIRRIRAWLADQPDRTGLLAYLTDDAPYRF